MPRGAARADGLRLWVDEREIHASDDIRKKMEDGLEHSRTLVLCLSANAFGSDWPRMEADTVRFRDPLSKERRFIPLRLDQTPIKSSLAQFVCINWPAERSDSEYGKLLEACRLRLKIPAETKLPYLAGAEKPILHIRAGIHVYAFNPDGKQALTAEIDATVRLWDLETGRSLRIFTRHTAPVLTIAWNPDRHRALSGSLDSALRLWDVKTGNCLRVLKGHTDTVRTVAWSSNQRYAVSGSDDQTMRLWDVETSRCLRVFKGHADGITAVTMSSDQRLALSCSSDRTVRVWDVDIGHCHHTLRGHTGPLYALDLIENMCWALSGSQDRTVRLWDVGSGRCERVFEGHVGAIYSVAFSPNQRLAVSASEDGTVRLWHLDMGRCLGVRRGSGLPMTTAAWSADSRVFFGESGGGIHVWDVSKFLSDVRSSDTPASASLRAREDVHYTNAKVLLVGDTGVGKSGLAERLVHKQFVPTRSSHARKAYLTRKHRRARPGRPTAEGNSAVGSRGSTSIPTGASIEYG